MIFHLSSYDIKTIIIGTVLGSTAILSAGNIHTQFICPALLESLKYHKTQEGTGKGSYSLARRTSSDACSQKKQHWQEQGKIQSLLGRIYLLLHQKIIPGKTRALKNTPRNYLDSVLLLSFSMDLTMQGAVRAGSGPKGVQMQQTDLPAGYNMFPEGTISFRGQGTA